MKEYDFYIPLFTNDGKRVNRRKLKRLKLELIHEFGGLTYFPQKNEGLWKLGHVTFRDKVVILRVMARSSNVTKRVIRRLKARIRKDWQQDDVLIVERSVRAV